MELASTCFIEEELVHTSLAFSQSAVVLALPIKSLKGSCRAGLSRVNGLPPPEKKAKQEIKINSKRGLGMGKGETKKIQ